MDRAMGVKASWARDFVSWVHGLNEEASITPEARKQLLINWERAATNGQAWQYLGCFLNQTLQKSRPFV
jgi:hypothetical protein